MSKRNFISQSVNSICNTSGKTNVIIFNHSTVRKVKSVHMSAACENSIFFKSSEIRGSFSGIHNFSRIISYCILIFFCFCSNSAHSLNIIKSNTFSHEKIFCRTFQIGNFVAFFNYITIFKMEFYFNII